MHQVVSEDENTWKIKIKKPISATLVSNVGRSSLSRKKLASFAGVFAEKVDVDDDNGDKK